MPKEKYVDSIHFAMTLVLADLKASKRRFAEAKAAISTLEEAINLHIRDVDKNGAFEGLLTLTDTPLINEVHGQV